MTADAALLGMAGLQRGEVVLVHAAAGGVGLAALQVTAEAGGVAMATAGGATKRTLLRSLGLSCAVASRDTSFVEDGMLHAAGIKLKLGSADVVLNTLTSPGMVAASLSLLGPGGRFVEISKRDIWSRQRVAMVRPGTNDCFCVQQL